MNTKLKKMGLTLVAAAGLLGAMAVPGVANADIVVRAGPPPHHYYHHPYHRWHHRPPYHRHWDHR